MHLLLGVWLFASACSALPSEPAPDDSLCTELRDHLVELRLLHTDPMERGSRRAALTNALGHGFVSRCRNTLSMGQVRCAFGADSVAAADRCMSSPIAPAPTSPRRYFGVEMW
jgi:hypothetical protein